MPLAYTQSDELSVVISPNCSAFGRRSQKLTTVLSGQASATMSLFLERPCVFDARALLLPTSETVGHYLQWRQQDAHRNALSAYAYWQLRKEGGSAKGVSKQLEGAGAAEKNELLFERGINFNDTPVWQRRGIVLRWETYEKAGQNPKSGEETLAIRRRIVVDDCLEMRDAFDHDVNAWLRSTESIASRSIHEPS